MKNSDQRNTFYPANGKQFCIHSYRKNAPKKKVWNKNFHFLKIIEMSFSFFSKHSSFGKINCFFLHQSCPNQIFSVLQKVFFPIILETNFGGRQNFELNLFSQDTRNFSLFFQTHSKFYFMLWKSKNKNTNLPDEMKLFDLFIFYFLKNRKFCKHLSFSKTNSCFFELHKKSDFVFSKSFCLEHTKLLAWKKLGALEKNFRFQKLIHSVC